MDGEDDLPLDPTETKDFDKDGIGDNTDLDDDNDGLSDQEEELQGTDPKNQDSDDDGLLDKEELDLGCDPLDSDSDNDGLTDKKKLTSKQIPLILILTGMECLTAVMTCPRILMEIQILMGTD